MKKKTTAGHIVHKHSAELWLTSGLTTLARVILFNNAQIEDLKIKNKVRAKKSGKYKNPSINGERAS